MVSETEPGSREASNTNVLKELARWLKNTTHPPADHTLLFTGWDGTCFSQVPTSNHHRKSRLVTAVEDWLWSYPSPITEMYIGFKHSSESATQVLRILWIRAYVVHESCKITQERNQHLLIGHVVYQLEFSISFITQRWLDLWDEEQASNRWRTFRRSISLRNE